MADWYTSLQSVQYGRLIQLNTVCVLWQADTPQYSLCMMADWYTSIRSVCYGRLIYLNTVCVLWLTDIPQYSLCIMRDWYTIIQSVYFGRLIHLNTVCVLWQLIHVHPGSNCLAPLFIQICCCLQCSFRTLFPAVMQSPCADVSSIIVWSTCLYQDGSWYIPCTFLNSCSQHCAAYWLLCLGRHCRVAVVMLSLYCYRLSLISSTVLQARLWVAKEWNVASASIAQLA